MAETKSGFGGCRIDWLSPPQDKLTRDTKVFNLVITFEEALKLNLALSECLSRLNRYNRSTKAGKSTAAHIAVHLNKMRMTVLEAKIPEDRRNTGR